MSTYPAGDFSISSPRAVDSCPVRTTKGRVATEPFPDMSVKISRQGVGPVKVARVENQVTLVPLKVLFRSEDGRFLSGQTVYVRGNLYTQPWAKEMQEISGIKFIVVPENFVEVILG